MDTKELSEYWDKNRKEYSVLEPNPFAIELVNKYKNSNKKDLLDLGCGDGRDTGHFIENSFNVTTLDIAEGCVNRIKTVYGSKVNAICQDIRNLNFNNESFDIIYAHLTLHYFTDEETTKIFDNIYNLLKKDGIFFVKCKSIKDRLCNDSQGKKIADYTYFKGHIRHFFSMDYLKSKLNKFNIIDFGEENNVMYDGYDSSFVYSIARK